jgi:hypothetical protein
MCYVCCALLLLSSSILHYIPCHQQSPMPFSADTHLHQHCRASNPLLLSHYHHYHYHNHRPHSTMSASIIKAAPYCCCCCCCCKQSSCLRCDVMFCCVTLMCQWYCNPPAGFAAAAVAGLWFDWLLLCVCGTAGK